MLTMINKLEKRAYKLFGKCDNKTSNSDMFETYHFAEKILTINIETLSL